MIIDDKADKLDNQSKACSAPPEPNVKNAKQANKNDTNTPAYGTPDLLVRRKILGSASKKSK